MRVVCFDVGGVLIEINHNWKGAMEDAGLDEALAKNYDFPLVEFEAFNAFQKGAMGWEDYCIDLGRYLGGIPPEQSAKVHNAILRVPYSGIGELIDALHHRGIRTGCLSNTNAPHWETFFNEPRLAMLRKIDFPVASHLIGAEKPDKRMYRAFEAECGGSGQEIVYFDDGLPNVISAGEIDWQAFVIDPNQQTGPQMRQHLEEVGWL